MTGAVFAEDARASAGTPQYRRALIALFCAALATFAQVYAPQGLLPDIARDFEVSASASSLVIGSTTLGLAVAMIPWGRLSDRIGRLAALRLALVLAVVSSFASPLMPTFEALVVMRFIEGLFLAGLPAIGVLALSETVSPLVFGAAVGGFVAGNSIGGLLGRLFSGWMAELFGWQSGMIVVSSLAAVAALLFIVLMPKPAVPPARGLPFLAAAKNILNTPGVMVMVAQAFLLMGGFVAIYNYLGFRLQLEPYAFTVAQASLLFIAYLAGTFSSRAVWAFTDRFTQVGVLLASIALMVIGVGVMLLTPLIAIIVGLVLLTMGFFGAHSIALTLTSRRASPGSASMAPSLYYLAYYFGSTVFGWAGGVAYVAGGWQGTSLMVATLSLGAAALAWGHARRHGGLRGVDASAAHK